MTRLRTFKEGEGFQEATGIDALRERVDGEGTVLWVAIDAASQDELEEIETVLKLHPLTMESLEHDEDRPRVRQYDKVLSMVFFAVRGAQGEGDDIEFDAVKMLVGRRIIVTIVKTEMPELDEAYERWTEIAHRLPADAGAPLYCILDTIVDGYLPVIDRIADKVDEVEDQVIESHAAGSLALIFTLKKSMLRFRRVTAAGRDVVNTLMVRDEVFSPGNVIYMQDVYDHIVRVTDSVDTYRDLLSNAMDSYLSVTSNQLAEGSNRLNMTMQMLTSWSIMIGCGAVITGLYGMNVRGIPLAQHRLGFASVLLILIGVAGVLLAVFRRKRWI